MFVLGSVGLLLLRPWVLSTFEDFAVKQTWWDLSSNQIQLRAGKSIWVGVKLAAERKRRREFTTNTSYFGYLIIHIVLIKRYSKVVYFSKKVIFDFSKIFFNYCRICTMYHVYDWPKILDIRYYPFLKGHNLGDEKKTIISIINTSTFLRWQNKCHIILEPI